jgi:DNA invertase Pin-like site-specific DNA recombinase
MVNRMNEKTAFVNSDSKSRTAYSYIRFSRAEQVKGDSQRRQYETTLAYCDRNNLVLDETLSLQDLGISAYRGKNATQGALSAFIRAVESGTIPHGSTLIVESLDRLSRDQLGRAQSLILGILEQGITIVTLSPEREYTPDSANNLGAAIEIIVTLYGPASRVSTARSRLRGATTAPSALSSSKTILTNR